MVSHRWLLQAREPGIKASHLSCAASAIVHSKGIVKVHGVFPSSCGQPASSPALQVRRVSRQDSRTFVTPFVQVGTYPTRNFAQPCYVLEGTGESFLFRSPLHVAMQLGPSHSPAGSWRSGVWPLRISNAEDARSIFPADCLHRSDCHSSFEYRRILRRPSI